MGIAILAAVFVDLAFGEPKTRLHPIALLGAIMAKVDVALRSLARRPLARRIAGLFTVMLFVALTYMVGTLIVLSARRVFPGFEWVAHAVLVWLSISTGELVIVNMKINRALESGDIDGAKSLLKCLVGRDVDKLNEDQIRAAALESLAENLVDAGIAPLFYAFIGGGALAMAYRVINTLDSMFDGRRPVLMTSLPGCPPGWRWSVWRWRIACRGRRFGEGLRRL